MKKIAAVALIALSTSTTIAQEPDWDRWFVGFDAGYIWRTTTTVADGTIERDGFTAGVVAGRWWLVDSVAVGFEAALRLGGTSMHRSESPTATSLGWNFDVWESATVGARAKVGVPVGSAIAYGAAGLHYIHGNSKIVWGGGGSISRSDLRFGGTLTVGGEMMIARNVAVKAEAGLNVVFPEDSTVTNHSGWGALVGVNYYFD